MSLVRSRIADLEASTGASTSRTTTWSSCSSPAAPAQSTIPTAYHRERLQVQPSIKTVPSLSGTSNGDEDYQSAEGLLDADSQQRSPSSSAAADIRPVDLSADTHQHHHERDDPIRSLAGGYYAKPRKQEVARESEAEAARRRSAAAAAIVHQQQAENKRMARKITQLEATLAASEGRIAHLKSSSARAAENASRLRRETEAASAVKEDYARRACQLEDTLAQAEKRASWLQGELEVVWACGTQRVAELEYDLELARRQQLGEETLSTEAGSDGNESTTEQGSTDTSGGSSLCGGSSRGYSRRHGVALDPRDGLDKMMSDTQKALSSLRTKFYRAMGEKEKLQASRCACLENKLQEHANSSTIATTTASNSSNGNNMDDADTTAYAGEGSSDQRNALRGHQRTTSENRKPSSDRNRGNEKEKASRGEGGSHSRSSSSSSSRSRSSSSSASSSTVNSSTSSSATVAVKAAPVTTVGGKFSWRWSPPVRTGPRLSARDDE